MLSGKKRQNHIFSTNIISYTCFTKKGLSFESKFYRTAIKMNELTKQMQQIMHPRAVLVAYECETTGYSTPRSYLELRPVNEKGRMGAGIPVTYEFMNSLVESYTESMSGIPHGRIPGNMLLCDSRKGRERYIWYNPPQKRKMYFQDGLHITDGTFNVPGVIYVVERE